MKRFQSGQAIAEFVVSTAAFGVVLIGLVIIANMLHVQTTAHKAARYMAWERMAYTEADYEAKLNSPANSPNGDSFDQEISVRFLDGNGSGFGQNSTGVNRYWRNPQNGQSLVALELGAAVDTATTTTAQSVAVNFLSSNSGQLADMDSNGGLSVDTISPAQLSIPFSIVNNQLLSGEQSPEARASFALVADGWAPGSEQQFSDQVEAMRSNSLAIAHKTLVGGILGVFGGFQEIPQRLNNGNAPFNMVSPTQSMALPSNLPMYVEE